MDQFGCVYLLSNRKPWLKMAYTWGIFIISHNTKSKCECSRLLIDSMVNSVAQHSRNISSLHLSVLPSWTCWLSSPHGCKMAATAPGMVMNTMTLGTGDVYPQLSFLLVRRESLSQISHTSLYPELYLMPMSKLILDNKNRKPGSVEWAPPPSSEHQDVQRRGDTQTT